MTVAFIDDSPEQIAAMQENCPRVRTIKVRGKTRKRRWLRRLPPSVGVRPCSEAYIDVGAGIDRAEIDRILATLRKKGDTGLFDWGRTLAQVKGVNLDAARGPGQQEDVLRWAVGGAARLRMLRDMFAELRRRGVKIAMLSNSPTCSLPGWRALIRRLVGGHVSYMCGHGDKGRRLTRKMRQLC
jgi:hypothetical protein